MGASQAKVCKVSPSVAGLNSARSASGNCITSDQVSCGLLVVYNGVNPSVSNSKRDKSFALIGLKSFHPVNSFTSVITSFSMRFLMVPYHFMFSISLYGFMGSPNISIASRLKNSGMRELKYPSHKVGSPLRFDSASCRFISAKSVSFKSYVRRASVVA